MPDDRVVHGGGAPPFQAVCAWFCRWSGPREGTPLARAHWPAGEGGRTRRKVSQAKVWVEPLVDFSCLTQPRPESDWIVTAHRHMIAKGDDANGFGFGFGGRA